ncbi:MAG: aldo/keto reductase [Actinobacteria bacterium]|nr:aldo/keto reductase [Actinomycetota bacterium]MCG2798440.1 aldo/keto reductase [Cellulomonas sp.]
MTFPVGLRLVLGGNVFGWTADEPTGRAVLDRFADAGGTLVDTADVYSAWVDGHTGGESELIIGRWLATRPAGDRPQVATKVSQHPQFTGLSAATVKAAAQASLTRLGLDQLDLYYAHFDDAQTPIAETAGAFSELVDEGLVAAIGISNYSPERIDEWFAAVAADGLHAPVALQPHYNLVERGYEEQLAARAREHDLAVFPYFGLARGFLTGKYRDGGAAVDSPRAGGALPYLDDRGRRVLAVLDELAAAHSTSQAAVALSWLHAQPTVTAPIASARTLGQLDDLLASARLDLAPDELAALGAASV